MKTFSLSQNIQNLTKSDCTIRKYSSTQSYLHIALFCAFFDQSSASPVTSALIGQMQRPSFLRAEPPCVFSWLSSCLRGEETPPFPYLVGICQRTRLLVLVRPKYFLCILKDKVLVSQSLFFCSVQSRNSSVRFLV